MNIQDIIRAWKDRNYLESLTEEQRALLPSNPIGEVLSQEELLAITGGLMQEACATWNPNTCSGPALF